MLFYVVANEGRYSARYPGRCVRIVAGVVPKETLATSIPPHRRGWRRVERTVNIDGEGIATFTVIDVDRTHVASVAWAYGEEPEPLGDRRDLPLLAPLSRMYFTMPKRETPKNFSTDNLYATAMKMDEEQKCP